MMRVLKVLTEKVDKMQEHTGSISGEMESSGKNQRKWY